MMEDFVSQLAELQANQKEEESARDSDGTVILLREAVAYAKGRLEMAEYALADDLAYYDPAIDGTIRDIETIKAQILEAWDGEKKTLQYPAGTLKFRTTQSLKIVNPGLLMADIISHMRTGTEVLKYVSGFNKTEVKEFMSVISEPGAAELVSKTTVKLDVV